MPQKSDFHFFRLIEKRKSDERRSRKQSRYRQGQRSAEDPLEGTGFRRGRGSSHVWGLSGEAGNYVKEIINLTSEERKQRHLTEEERVEQEQRRVKLLEAGECAPSGGGWALLVRFGVDREMERMKERTKVERERRHLERALKRHQDDEPEYYKRLRTEPPIQASGGNTVQYLAGSKIAFFFF